MRAVLSIMTKGGRRYEEEIHPLNFVVFYKC